MDLEKAKASIASIKDAAEQALSALNATNGEVKVVHAGEALQPVLDTGGKIEFEGEHSGQFFVRVPGTVLVGRAGAALRGGRNVAPALYVPLGARDVTIANVIATSAGDQAVVRLGFNGAEQTVENEPYNITLEHVIVPSHRGKRGIELNCRDSVIRMCETRDVWDPDGRQSQGLAVYNSTGNITVSGGFYEAGSECILIGGDEVELPGVPTNIVFEDLTLSKPIVWRGDGINHNVANLFEVKNGDKVVVRRCHLLRTWTDAQVSWAIVITPTLDGVIGDVTIEDNIIEDVGGALNMLGRAYKYHTPGRANVLFQRNKLAVDHLAWGGTGALAQLAAEVGSAIFKDNEGTLSGQKLLSYAYGNVMEADGTVRRGLPAQKIHLLGSKKISCGRYGITLDGPNSTGTGTTAYVNGGPNREGFASVEDLYVADNVFVGSSISSVMKKNFPANIYTTA